MRIGWKAHCDGLLDPICERYMRRNEHERFWHSKVPSLHAKAHSACTIADANARVGLVDKIISARGRT
jgi:hypothetical protein